LSRSASDHLPIWAEVSPDPELATAEPRQRAPVSLPTSERAGRAQRSAARAAPSESS
jgi:hypothetical protein